jgi:hypothetical protein
MVCDSCGAEFADGDESCPACGAPATASANPAAAAGTFPPPTIAARATDATEIVISAPEPIEFDEELFESTPTPPPPPADGEPATISFDAPATATMAAPGVATPADPTLATTTTTTAGGPATADPTTVQTLAASPLPPGPLAPNVVPTVFDGDGDISEHPPERDSFRIRLAFILAVFGGIAAALVPAADIIDVRTTRPVDGIAIGASGLDDIASNLAVASYVGVGAMLLGGLVACWGFRWASGLAGGAGLALVGWAALVLGLVEARIETAEEVTRTSAVGFTLEVTRDLGYWLVVAVAGIGVLVFIASLRLSRTGRRPGLNPWIAAVGAVSALVLAAGPLIPVNGASFSDNFRIAADGDALPWAFFAGRLGQLALIGVLGAIGFLLVRWYGVGLAAGSVSVATWMWFSSLAELGDTPIGIAWRNPGATDTTPHAVTTVGMVLTLVILLIAAIAASVQHRRVYHR